MRTSQARANQQPQVQKKKPAEKDTSYVPIKKITKEDKGHEMCGKVQSKQKKINLVKKTDLEKQNDKDRLSDLHRECRKAEEEAKRIEEEKGMHF